MRSTLRVRPLILLYNHIFVTNHSVADLSAADQQCFTTDRALFEQADAVVFHIPNLEDIASLVKPRGQLWVMLSMESIVNYPCAADSDFLRHFDLRMTYERSADIWASYLDDRETWNAALRRPIPDKTEPAPCVMFQSSNINGSGRMEYVAELMKHIQVDSYGKALQNRRVEGEDKGIETKREIIGRYKFCLSLENSLAPDYVTEKFFEPLMCGSVPVYLGPPNADDFAPGEQCYVDIRNFADPRDLAAHLRGIAADETLYQQFLDWRHKPLREAFEFDFTRRSSMYANLLQAVKERMLAARHTAPATADLPPFHFDHFLSQSGDPLLWSRLRRYVRTRINAVLPKW